MSAPATTLADRVLFGLFALFLLSSSFSIALAQSSLGLALAVYIGILAVRRENPFGGALRPVYLAIGLYVLWVLISALAGPTPGRSVLREREDWLFLIIPIAVHLVRIEPFRRRLVRTLAIAVLLMGAYGVVQHFTGLNWPHATPPLKALEGGYIVQGSFAHRLTYGNYFAVASIFVLACGILAAGRETGVWRRFLFLAAFVGLAATVLSYARMALAGLPLALLFLAALKGRRWLAAAAGAVAIGAVAVYLWVPGVAGGFRAALDRDLTGENQASRTYIWEKSLAIVAENPITGVGLGNFYEAYARQNDSLRGENRVWPHAHNDVLNVAAVAGIPGALLFVAMWVIVFWYLRRGWQRFRGDPAYRALIGAAMAASVMFALCSLSEAAFADEEPRQLLMGVWGMGLGWVNRPSEETPTAAGSAE
ncbi:MAG TPA: O-antigen ligase family protein [candidate division Zixibacteria bacterium]|nr:O-antigen ligase family protein [candidate division Zixibacteria bacterium]MDD4917380.1 O-antigen ligase family protein [candidate division Zixibacteria bacterium]MDM7972378.1 O-antigen ligase family protein [candidate division Zixibacteria bacterium]HOD66182.1 O-antigen ligase family protein [candidate division Zixibacteria bacterium]HPC11196.1 O-antigen ligase family protein [candidate division Zixibacteria bacterium]